MGEYEVPKRNRKKKPPRVTPVGVPQVSTVFKKKPRVTPAGVPQVSTVFKKKPRVTPVGVPQVSTQVSTRK